MTEIRCGAKVDTRLGVGEVIMEGDHGVVNVYFGNDHPYRQHPFLKSEVRLLEPESTES